MRRGHPGMGGWRNESPRHFRPRGGGVPHYRPPQPYQLDLASKYGGPRMAGPRLHRGVPHFYSHSGPRHDRYSYRPHINPPRLADRDDRDHNYPPPHLRQKDSDHVSPYKNILTYCESRAINDHSSVNNMGDVDHRHNFNMPETFSQPPPWPNPIENRRTSFDNRPHNRATQYHDNIDGNQVPSFTAHRPPSSDHYGSNIPTAIDNSNSFSRSVDDTVDIVRRRLLNRSESQSNSDNPPAEQNPDDKPDAAPIATNYQDEPQTSPAKKRTQRIKLNVQSNCDKIKNKIVHEIFKMDKGKMHKLMDNPNSSTKFEYAINSLITESQNSYDRHMRSVAEKSLCSSSVEFMQDDNNTIYEDTFLKQMQCILEPQDTVLLEDIKPFVMAELNKVLQLDEFDQRFDMVEEDPNYYQPEEPTSATKYSNEYHYEDFSKVSPMPHYPEDDNVYYQEQQTSQSSFTSMETPGSPEQFHLDPEPQLFERRVPRKSTDFNQFSQFKRESTESREQARQSADRERHKLSEERRLCDSPVPIFDSNVEQLSDEEDPFADLDKQYHVAVDPNFIEAELDKQLMSATENSPCETESITKVQLLESVKDKPPVVKKEVLLSPEIAPKDIKKEIDSQILSIAKSPLKLSSSLNRVKSNRRIAHTPNISVKNDTNHVFNPNKNNNASTEYLNHEMNSDNNQDQNEIKDAQRESKKLENSNTAKSTISSNARKRSIDQKPSHRKEKRKKSETIPVEPNKQILNKNIIINVNDCSSKSNEKKCDAAKSIFNLYFPKDDGEKELPKDVKNVELNDKGYSDKYVKRKETPKKKEQEPKRSRSLSTSHSNISPKDNNNSCSETQPKAELKIKLKSIDMFLETQKKISSSHQSHKNTAQPTTSTTKKAEEKKPLLISKCKIKRHVATQIIPKTHAKDTQTVFPKISKLCQTETKKTVVKATQTSPVTFEKSGIKSADTFERMKEIDLEIQVLLQEKFKLYNSLEAKQSSSNPMQNLGMTVVDVTQISESKEDLENEDVLSEDAIVDEFTSIPVEELEQIALESVAEEPSEPPKAQKRNQRQKVADRTRVKSRSPTVVRSSRKSNAPNISLIEQIITDDRPLEDIISLDDLEVPEVKQTHSKKKTKSRSQKASKKKTSKKSKTVKPVNPAAIALGIRECFVALKRVDMSRYRNTITAAEPPKQEPVELSVVEEPIIAKTEVPEITDVGVETVVTEPDIPFDMLDVSEDIVIGDECEIKSEEKDSAERVDLPINEDIILDNSQSSEDVAPAEAGQSDKECKLFDYSADEALKRDSVTVTGHADAVLAIECVENNFLAACLDGNVYHFNNDGQLLTTLRGSNLAVTCLTIVKEKYGTTVYTGSLDSRIRYYDLEKGLEKGPECNVLSPIQTMDRAWDTVFVGTRTGFVLQFECKNNMLIPVSTVKFSEQSILALRALKEGPRKVLLVAARSENVTIKDAQTGLLLRTLEGPKMTVYTLLYEDGKVYCGTSSHQIHVFDYASGSHWTSHSGGKGCVCLRAVGGLLLAGCYDGCVYIYREGDGRPYAVLRGPSLMLLSLAVQGTKIIAGYKDRSLYIWKIPLSILKEMIL